MWTNATVVELVGLAMSQMLMNPHYGNNIFKQRVAEENVYSFLWPLYWISHLKSFIPVEFNAVSWLILSPKISIVNSLYVDSSVKFIKKIETKLGSYHLLVADKLSKQTDTKRGKMSVNLKEL